MSDTSLWLKCIVVLLFMSWYALGLLRYLDDYFKNQFDSYLQKEVARNPHLADDIPEQLLRAKAFPKLS
jgi:hypothetical protein